MNIDNLIAECTAYDFKVMLEEKKPKSWLKSVSAFANGSGGSLFFGVDNDHRIIGLADVQHVGEAISSAVKDRMDPLPEVELIPIIIENKQVLQLKVKAGRYTPYYYVADGQRVPFVRMGDESIPATDEDMKRLVLKGTNRTFDSLNTDVELKHSSFVILENTFEKRTGHKWQNKFLKSFGLTKDERFLSNAGVLFSDDCSLSQSRLYCTRWDGKEKTDAINDAEFKGNILMLLREAMNFVKSNTRKGWEKLPDGRKNKPEYAERAVLEMLVNHFIHRDYTVMGGEVHLDIYDDRITVTSPGGMYSGEKIQDLDLDEISSERRNPVLADIMAQLDLMEKRGSGLKKICDETSMLESYVDERKPKFKSTTSQFMTTIYSMEYEEEPANTVTKLGLSSDQVVTKLSLSSHKVVAKLALSTPQVVYMLHKMVQPMSAKEMRHFCDQKDASHFKSTIIDPLIAEGLIAMTQPGSPKSPKQKYYLTDIAKKMLKCEDGLRQADGVSEVRVERLIKEFDEALPKFPVRLPQMEGQYAESLPVVDARCFQSAYKLQKSMFSDGGQWIYETPELYLTEIQGNIWQHYNVQFLLHRPDAIYNIRFSEIKDAFKKLALDGNYAVVSSIYLGTYDDLYGGDIPLVETDYGYQYGNMPIYRVPSHEPYLIVMRREFLPRCEAKTFEGDNKEYRLINEQHLLYSNIYNMKDEGDGLGLAIMRDIRFYYPSAENFHFIELAVDRMENVASELEKIKAFG